MGASSVQIYTNLRKENELIKIPMKKLLLAGMIAWAAPAYAEIVCPVNTMCPTCKPICYEEDDYVPNYLREATDEEEAGSDAAALVAKDKDEWEYRGPEHGGWQRKSAPTAFPGVTSYYGDNPPHWDPTMADAPSWLKRQYKRRRHMHR